MRFFNLSIVCALVVAGALAGAEASAAIYASGTFADVNGDATIYKFEKNNNTFLRTSFATIQNAGQLSGIAYRGSTQSFFVGDINNSALYKINAAGAITNTYITPFGPTGITVSANGNVYVAGLGNPGGAVYLLNEGLGTFSTAVDLGGLNTSATGVAMLGNNDFLVSTFGQGVYRSLNGVVSQFSSNFSAVAQIAVADPNNIYVGSTDFSGFGIPTVADRVYHFDANGGDLAPISVNYPAPPGGPYSSQYTNPSGVFVDPDGNILVAAGGRTSPGSDPGAPFDGGLLQYDSLGQLQASLTGIESLSNVTFAVTAVPEPGSIAFLMVATAVGGVIAKRRRQNGASHENV